MHVLKWWVTEVIWTCKSEAMGKNSHVNLSSFEPMLSYAASCK